MSSALTWRRSRPRSSSAASNAKEEEFTGPDLLEFCRTRRGLQPGQAPTEQDILVYNWVRAPKRVTPRLVALRSADRQSRVQLPRERGS